jgi:hypothetical protein
MTGYTPSLALQAALDRINHPPQVFNKKNEPVETEFEHHVGTWACTKLKEVFNQEHWAITPEQIDRHSRKKPDLTVEKAVHLSTSPASSQNAFKLSMMPYLVMELKKVGQRKEEALNQLCDAILETIDWKGNKFGEDQFEVYALVQSGVEIGFFEYHSDQSILDEENIPHFRGCVSLSQDYFIKGQFQVVMRDKPTDLRNLYTDFERLKTARLKDEDKKELRQDAYDYTTPCFFDLNKHQEEIHFLFQHMLHNVPRSSR